MISLEWTELAEKQKDSIVDYIALDNIEAAFALDILMESAAESLLAQPEKGRPGRVPGTRELVFHEHYMLIYKFLFAEERISILTVLHSSRQWPLRG